MPTWDFGVYQFCTSFSLFRIFSQFNFFWVQDYPYFLADWDTQYLLQQICIQKRTYCCRHPVWSELLLPFFGMRKEYFYRFLQTIKQLESILEQLIPFFPIYKFFF